ncbi:MAG: hypothetical protein AW09_001748 [Candidatus Accumulibacter phosphatis]|uniref:Uncharacterized protein n=1 Tax=Candidatus Accumulibacter phosphatis TaxID=327160 RepID=A0A080LYL0_9PROT|nr:hypothetical protein [Accumulibacter sp.]KFB73025.1 MAG: hypothetical protein AW09_001748 [Candidatus Accumulibacter phosphatis]
MRIPSELLPPIGNLGKEVDRKSEPVEPAARLADELAASPQEQPPPSKNGGRPESPKAVGPDDESKPEPVERRHADRRSKDQPILLDTRTNRGRRRAPGEALINIKV